MKFPSLTFYNLTLALWVGGISLFTFVVTPAIFKSFGRDHAGEIVGKLLPGYFLYNLILAAVALILFFLPAGDRMQRAWRISLALLVAAVVIAAYIRFSLYPAAVQVRKEVVSFESMQDNSPARKRFRKLHALSASLNLFLLADGTVLLVLGPVLKK